MEPVSIPELPPDDTARRERAKARLYVIFQVGGWGFFWLLQLVFTVGGFSGFALSPWSWRLASCSRTPDGS